MIASPTKQTRDWVIVSESQGRDRPGVCFYSLKSEKECSGMQLDRLTRGGGGERVGRRGE